MFPRSISALCLSVLTCAILPAADEPPKLNYEQRLEAMMEAVGKGQITAACGQFSRMPMSYHTRSLWRKLHSP